MWTAVSLWRPVLGCTVTSILATTAPGFYHTSLLVLLIPAFKIRFLAVRNNNNTSCKTSRPFVVCEISTKRPKFLIAFQQLNVIAEGKDGALEVMV